MKDIREDIACAQINTDILKSLEIPRRCYWYTGIGVLGTSQPLVNIGIVLAQGNAVTYVFHGRVL